MLSRRRILRSFLIAGALTLLIVFFSLSQEKNKTEALSEKDHASRIRVDCQNAQEGWERCFADKFYGLTEKNSIGFSLKVLSELQKIDNRASACHFISHSISIAETRKSPKDWENILRKLDPSDCTGGFVHGVIEAYTEYDKNFRVDENSVSSICDKVKTSAGEGQEFNCAHIMGHLLLVEKGKDIDTAVSVCDKLEQNLRYECFSGVYMENETRENLVTHGLSSYIPWNEETTANQEQICQNAKGLAQIACYREIVHMYAFLYRGDPGPVFEACNRAPVQEAREECYFHGAGIIVVESEMENERLKEICSFFQNENSKLNTCMNHVLGSLILSSKEFAPRGIDFCSTITENGKKDCFVFLGQLLLNKTSEQEREKICQKSPDEYRVFCEGSLETS